MDKILNLFIEEPEKEFHVRQISKIIKKSPTTTSKYLKEYEKKGILTSKENLNHLFFKANSENAEFKQIKLCYNLDLLNKSGLIEKINGEFNNPEAIILFGSFAKAENTKKSDIDLLIISPIKKEINLKQFEKKIKFQIQLHIHSKEDIERMKNKNKDLLNNFVNGIKLRGFWEVFR
jgi:predicted nucleotidyltransferase